MGEGSQPPSLGLGQTFVDLRSLLEVHNHPDTLEDQLEFSFEPSTNTRKRPPRPSFTAPPSRSRSPPANGLMKEGKGPTIFSHPESSISHQVPTAPDDISQSIGTPNKYDTASHFSTQKDYISWEENVNSPDPTTDNLSCADYRQGYPALEYRTTHDTNYTHEQPATQADSVHTPSSLAKSHTTFPSPGTSTPYPGHSSDSPSRKRFRDDCYAWVINDFK